MDWMVELELCGYVLNMYKKKKDQGVSGNRAEKSRILPINSSRCEASCTPM